MSKEMEAPGSLRERKKQKARSDILDAARKLVSRNGYVEARMRDIATEADVSYQTLYNYFPTKARIAESLLADGVATLAEQIDHLIARYSGDLLKTLNAVNRQRLTFFSEQDTDLWRELCVDLIQRDVQPDVYQLIDRAAHARIAALLEKSQSAGELDKRVDIDVMAHTIFCLSEYAMMANLVDPNASLERVSNTLDIQIRVLLTPYLNAPANA